MYKDDVANLMSILGSHVATINLLPMTQTVKSITLAENDRAELAGELRSKIAKHRVLLEELKDKVEVTFEQQSEIASTLERQNDSLANIQASGQSISQSMQCQEVVLTDVQSLALTTDRNTSSILSSATDILNLITTTLSTVQAIATQLVKAFELCAKFTTEMRAAMGELLQRFWSLQAALTRIERALPIQVRLPILQFTDVFGDSMALPYQLCQNWLTFKELLRAMYINRQGWSRINAGQYLLMRHCGGRMITKNAWKNMVKEGDHLSMYIALDDLVATEGHCPYPSCQASLIDSERRHGGTVCSNCGRWAFSTPRISSTQQQDPVPILEFEYIDPTNLGDTEKDTNIEDIEMYRQIYVQTIQDSSENPGSSDSQSRSKRKSSQGDAGSKSLIVGGRDSDADQQPRTSEEREQQPDLAGKFEVEGQETADMIPPDARWTKISRQLVNPKALEAGNEPFEVGDDCVIVLRVLTRDEVQRYADVTQKIRG